MSSLPKAGKYDGAFLDHLADDVLPAAVEKFAG